MSPNPKIAQADSEIGSLSFPRKLAFSLAQAFAALLFIGSAGFTGFYLWNDKHNDERYVTRPEYLKDATQEQRDRQEMDEKLDELKKDVREVRDLILKRSQ